MRSLIHIVTLERLTEEQVASRYPRVAHGKPPLFWRRYGWEIVYPTTPPDYDPATQYPAEIPPERNENGTWRQRWEIRNYTAEELGEKAKERSTEDYKSMIRRKAGRLEKGSIENKYQAILLLKTIGE